MDSTLTINKHRSTNTNYFYNAGTNVDKTILIVKDALTTTTISITNTTKLLESGNIPGIMEAESAGNDRQLDFLVLVSGWNGREEEVRAPALE